MKKCTICKQEKPLSEYDKHKHMASGRTNICKSCHSEVARKSDERARERERELIDKWILWNQNLYEPKVFMMDFYTTFRGKIARRLGKIPEKFNL